jgi:p-aminobenzoyl-glutamate transporter AbgT
LESVLLAKKTDNLQALNKNAAGLSQCYDTMGNSKKALYYFKLSTAAKDTIFNASVMRKSLQTEMDYKMEAKEQAMKAEEEKKEVIAQQEKRQQRIITLSVSIVLIIVLIFSVIVLRSLSENKRKNKIITEQKLIVEAKQKEIVDSIKYAKRIQQALMPSDKYFDKNLRSLKNK